MMKFETLDGEVYEGETASEIVEAMMEAKFDPPRNRQSYRRATATRLQDMFGLSIDATSDENFLKSQVECGVLFAVA